MVEYGVENKLSSLPVYERNEKDRLSSTMYADGVYVTPKLTGMQLHSQELIFHKP